MKFKESVKEIKKAIQVHKERAGKEYEKESRVKREKMKKYLQARSQVKKVLESCIDKLLTQKSVIINVPKEYSKVVSDIIETDFKGSLAYEKIEIESGGKDIEYFKIFNYISTDDIDDI